jgi:nucleoside-specific outer membrane channel protein Tsx
VSGIAGYVLPRFENTVYVEIEKGDHFGIIDLVYDADALNIQSTTLKRKTRKDKDLFRRFTV